MKLTTTLRRMQDCKCPPMLGRAVVKSNPAIEMDTEICLAEALLLPNVKPIWVVSVLKSTIQDPREVAILFGRRCHERAQVFSFGRQAELEAEPTGDDIDSVCHFAVSNADAASDLATIYGIDISMDEDERQAYHLITLLGEEE